MLLILGFAVIAGGVLLLTGGITDSTFADVLKGNARQAYDTNQGVATAAPASSAAATVKGAVGSAAKAAVTLASGGNPFPGGWQPSRLDMGYDGTFKGQIASPISGKVVYSSASDPGWKGGGYVAIQSPNPIPGLASRTLYFAEGLIPTVKVGQQITQGQPIANAVPSPYNSIVGNIEWGLASDSNPGDPLAHSISNPAAMVLAFSHWAQTALGLAPPATTDHAGFP